MRHSKMQILTVVLIMTAVLIGCSTSNDEASVTERTAAAMGGSAALLAVTTSRPRPQASCSSLSRHSVRATRRFQCLR
jgi:hypothetical protein